MCNLEWIGFSLGVIFMRQNVDIVPFTLFGRGVISQLEEVIVKTAAKQILLLFDGLYANTTLYKHLSELEAVTAVQIDTDEELITSSQLREFTEKIKTEEYDLLIAMGQKHVLELLKMVALNWGSREFALETMAESQTLQQPVNTLFIPTTPEIAQAPYGVLYLDEIGILQLLEHRYLQPKVILLDPLLFSYTPPTVLAAASMETLATACEIYFLEHKNYWLSTLSLTALKLITTSALPAIFDKRNMQAKEAIAKAGMLVGIAQSYVKPNILVSLQTAITKRFRVPKAFTTTILLPHFSAYYYEQMSPLKREKLRTTLQIKTSSENESKWALITKFRSLFMAVGFPTDLTSIGVQNKDIFQIATEAFANYLTIHPNNRLLDQIVFETILRQAI